MWELLTGGAYVIHAAWLASVLVIVLDGLLALGGHPDALWRRVVRALWAELKLWYLPAVAVRHVTMLHGDMPPLFQAGLLLLDLLYWRLFRDVGDDDRWKRRRAKTAAAVRRVGARLTLTPAPGGA